jgi:hypothetical protein
MPKTSEDWERNSGSRDGRCYVRLRHCSRGDCGGGGAREKKESKNYYDEFEQMIAFSFSANTSRGTGCDWETSSSTEAVPLRYLEIQQVRGTLILSGGYRESE